MGVVAKRGADQPDMGIQHMRAFVLAVMADITGGTWLLKLEHQKERRMS